MADVKVDVTINEDFFRQLGHSREVEALLDAIARITMTNAKAAAPRDTGEYAGSIHTETVSTPYRKVKRVIASDRKAGYIESRYNTLRGALRKARRV